MGGDMIGYTLGGGPEQGGPPRSLGLILPEATFRILATLYVDGRRVDSTRLDLGSPSYPASRIELVLEELTDSTVYVNRREGGSR